MTKFKYVLSFLLGVCLTLGAVGIFNEKSEIGLKSMFLEKTAARYSKGDNHFDGDDTYREYYDMKLTDLDYNILQYILDVRRRDDIYVYINKNSNSTKRIWYIKSANVYGLRTHDEITYYFDKFDLRTFKFTDISEKEFEKHAKQELEIYSSYGMD